MRKISIRKDCIYVAEFSVGGGTNYIFRAYTDEVGGYKSFIAFNRTDPVFSKDRSGDYKWSEYTIRGATTNEGDWLIACEQEGKLVPRPDHKEPEVINQYEIY